MDDIIVVRDVDGGAGAICAQILGLRPPWLSPPPEPYLVYLETSQTHPSVIATINDEDVGITTLKHHSAYAAEIYLMTVRPTFRRQGVGRRMLQRVEARLRAEGTQFVQVKTTRPPQTGPTLATYTAFWLACGFRPLEEHSRLWPSSKPSLQLVKTVSPSP